MSIWDTWAADPRYAQVVNDPRFLQATPAYKTKIHDILFKYGFTGTPEQQAVAGPVEANPYSVASRLKQNMQLSQHNSFNAANAAGLEESGAASAAGHAINEDYKRGVSDAGSQMGGELGGALGDYTDTINGIFGDVELNPTIAPSPPPVPVGPAPGQASGVGTAFPTPQTPYTRTGPEAGGTVSAKVKKIGIKGNHGVLL